MLDLLAAVVVLIILSGVVLITKLCAGKLTPEASRKIIHITMGCVALTFPFVFAARQSVLYLGIIAILSLLLLRWNKNLREGIGSGLLGIQRKSFGEIYFVLSIVIVYLLHEAPFEYLISIAVLTFADSIAALIGTSYGRYNLALQHEDAKSSEGSVMFFIVAFICALVPLQLMTEVGRAEVLVISFLIGALAAMIEAVSTSGNDNLLLPLLTYSFLRFNTDQSLELLLIKFGVMLIFLVLAVVVYKMTNISKLAVAYSLLAVYVFMVQGGLMWVMPPLLLFLTFGILPMMKAEEKQMVQTYKVIECNGIIGILCLVLATFFPSYREILYLAFSLSFASHLAINTYSRFINFVGSSKEMAISCGLIKGLLFIALPTLVFTETNRWELLLYLLCLAASIPPAIYLNQKYDYKKVGNVTFRANKILVGTVVAVFVIVGGLIL